jgi:hypothetical protein
MTSGDLARTIGGALNDFRHKILRLEHEHAEAKSIKDRLKIAGRMAVLCNEASQPFSAPTPMTLGSSLKFIPDAVELATNPTNPVTWTKVLLEKPAEWLIGWYRRRPVAKLVRTAKQVAAMEGYDGLLYKHFGIDAAEAVIENRRGLLREGHPLYTFNSPDMSEDALRPTHADRRIALPAATDLVTTIAGLVHNINYYNGTMEAGSDVLDATRHSMRYTTEPFSQSNDRGLRIMVPGAGPAGAALVTYVAEVLGSTKLRLAQPAATAVSSVQATLNQPDQVRLSDFARATVRSFTLDLTDRVVTDASITAGERFLLSPVAGFSAADLGKVVTIPSAGRRTNLK